METASIFNKITDFGDVKHVVEAFTTSSSTEGGGEYDLAKFFAEDRIEACVEKPLEDAVKEDRFPRKSVQMAAIVQISLLFSQEETEPTPPPPPKSDAPQQGLPPSPQPVPKKDAASTFAELKELLEVDESNKEIPMIER